MNEGTKTAAADRIAAILQHLGIERAHFGAGLASELLPLLARNPGAVASITLVNPNRLEVRALAALEQRLRIVTGSAGLPASIVERALQGLPLAGVTRVPDYYTATWSDLVAEHPATVVAALLDAAGAAPATRGAGEPEHGEVAGITFRATGEGPALVLLPLLLAPSQWEPAVDELAARFRVVVLGGAHLGMVAMLESRGAEPGYQRVIASVLDAVAPRDGETIVEIGCGTGVLARWLAARTHGKNPIVATDLNPYFLREAAALAAAAGMGEVITFREANAEALPFEDGSLDVTFSSTVMEECDADRMLAEMVRVTKPGGRVAVVVRATDMPNVCTVAVDAAMQRIVEAPYPSVAEKGCADASLYDRFARSGLEGCELFPHLLTLRDPGGAAWAYREPFFLSQFDDTQIEAWHAAKAAAVTAGTFVFSSGLHCAVGTKPG